ncbi:hypothetical protein MJN47_28060, partial [Salmonella enterica subsp. enterica serovar Lubbock]|nr:hypothetical protein [Salmonella enterica subsp. enterica serovar Lubbock]
QLDSASLYMPGNSITSALANEFAEAESGLHVAALMELGLILFARPSPPARAAPHLLPRSSVFSPAQYR